MGGRLQPGRGGTSVAGGTGNTNAHQVINPDERDPASNGRVKITWSPGLAAWRPCWADVLTWRAGWFAGALAVANGPPIHRTHSRQGNPFLLFSLVSSRWDSWSRPSGAAPWQTESGPAPFPDPPGGPRALLGGLYGGPVSVARLLGAGDQPGVGADHVADAFQVDHVRRAVLGRPRGVPIFVSTEFCSVTMSPLPCWSHTGRGVDRHGTNIPTLSENRLLVRAHG